MSKATNNKTQKSSKFDVSFADSDTTIDHKDIQNDHSCANIENKDDDLGISLLENFHDDIGNLADFSDDDNDSGNSRLENFHGDIGNFSDYSDGYNPINANSKQIPQFNIKDYSNHRQSHNHHYQQHHHHHHQKVTLSQGDQYRKRIAEENRKIVRKHPELIDWNGIKTIGDEHYFKIPKDIHRKCAIRIFDCSSITAAIDCHSAHPSVKICLLNFANPIKPGGGYLNGRQGQEGSICRQTLLYPTLVKSYMYFENKQRGSRPEASDTMIYSPNVMVIRDDKYEKINSFPVDIISASAVDNSKFHVHNSEEIMENRIRKIILTAISENAEVLILGAFGCGIFKNNPTVIARIFNKILVEEDYQKCFYLIVFPIYKDSNTYNIFKSIFANK